ncbi:MAG TPA: hypothetical protein EYP17_09225, partial [Candidatus Latescibacteria bacterium]|nr:hypothetical protein [Candidatus Latescibacterota bacterium]
LLISGTYLAGSVLDTEGENLPQSIDPGNANPDVSTNGLQVFASEPSLRPLSSLGISPRAITPNGDLSNDRAEISFGVLQVERASVSVEIWDTSGRKVREVFSGELARGMYTRVWDGTDDMGELVQPGVYVCRVVVRTGSGTLEGAELLCVAY